MNRGIERVVVGGNVVGGRVEEVRTGDGLDGRVALFELVGSCHRFDCQLDPSRSPGGATLLLSTYDLFPGFYLWNENRSISNPMN